MSCISDPAGRGRDGCGPYYLIFCTLILDWERGVFHLYNTNIITFIAFVVVSSINQWYIVPERQLILQIVMSLEAMSNDARLLDAFSARCFLLPLPLPYLQQQ